MLSCHVHLLSLRALLFSEGKRQRSVSGVEGVHGVKERGMEEWETGWYVLYKRGKIEKKKLSSVTMMNQQEPKQV